MNLFTKKENKPNKNSIKIIFAYVMGMIVSGTVVYAASTINASDVNFTATTDINASNVQDAITKVYNSTSCSLSSSDPALYLKKDGTYEIAEPSSSYTGPYIKIGKKPYVCVKGNNNYNKCFDMTSQMDNDSFGDECSIYSPSIYTDKNGVRVSKSGSVICQNEIINWIYSYDSNIEWTDSTEQDGTAKKSLTISVNGFYNYKCGIKNYNEAYCESNN